MNEIISHILFADDIFLICLSREELEILKNVLQCWCRDFEMTISQIKTQVICPDGEDSWEIEHMRTGVRETKRVEHYKYLGISQYDTVVKTVNQFKRRVVDKAVQYRRLMHLQLSSTVDRVEMQTTQWKQVNKFCKRKRKLF